mmetsp:Transcript_40136/g.92226  ORF Transcript_40136/g.92226 Transcript_40136/m.92226 type:complete len:725 (-) Transcript_40136:8-2182(-)
MDFDRGVGHEVTWPKEDRRAARDARLAYGDDLRKQAAADRRRREEELQEATSLWTHSERRHGRRGVAQSRGVGQDDDDSFDGGRASHHPSWAAASSSTASPQQKQEARSRCNGSQPQWEGGVPIGCNQSALEAERRRRQEEWLRELAQQRAELDARKKLEQKQRQEEEERDRLRIERELNDLAAAARLGTLQQPPQALQAQVDPQEKVCASKRQDASKEDYDSPANRTPRGDDADPEAGWNWAPLPWDGPDDGQSLLGVEDGDVPLTLSDSGKPAEVPSGCISINTGSLFDDSWGKPLSEKDVATETCEHPPSDATSSRANEDLSRPTADHARQVEQRAGSEFSQCSTRLVHRGDASMGQNKLGRPPTAGSTLPLACNSHFVRTDELPAHMWGEDPSPAPPTGKTGPDSLQGRRRGRGRCAITTPPDAQASNSLPEASQLESQVPTQAFALPIDAASEVHSALSWTGVMEQFGAAKGGDAPTRRKSGRVSAWEASMASPSEQVTTPNLGRIVFSSQPQELQGTDAIDALLAEDSQTLPQKQTFARIAEASAEDFDTFLDMMKQKISTSSQHSQGGLSASPSTDSLWTPQRPLAGTKSQQDRPTATSPSAHSLLSAAKVALHSRDSSRSGTRPSSSIKGADGQQETHPRDGTQTAAPPNGELQIKSPSDFARIVAASEEDFEALLIQMTDQLETKQGQTSRDREGNDAGQFRFPVEGVSCALQTP